MNKMLHYKIKNKFVLMPDAPMHKNMLLSCFYTFSGLKQILHILKTNYSILVNILFAYSTQFA